MSQRNVEIVRRVLDAVNRRDLETLDALFHEEGEFESVLAASEGRVFRGKQGIRDYFAWFDDAFETYGSEVEDLIDAGEDRVVALLRFAARGRESGIALEQRIGIVFTLQGAQIVRMQSYFTPAEALEAVGLAESAIPPANDR
jgi:ketosteroid isomerase-like protein